MLDCSSDELVLSAPATHTSLKDIITAVASVYGVREGDIASVCRERHVARARFAVCWLARNGLRMSTLRIGKKIGRYHSTVLSATRIIDRDLPTCAITRQRIQRAWDMATSPKGIAAERLKQRLATPLPVLQELAEAECAKALEMQAEHDIIECGEWRRGDLMKMNAKFHEAMCCHGDGMDFGTRC